MMAVRANIGPFQTEEQALGEVVRRLIAAHDPEAIWLFGSRARGRAKPDSDFDLLVVVSPDRPDLAEDYDRIYAPICGLGVGCDVVPCAAHVFAEESAHVGSLCWAVKHQGRRLYERR